MTGFVVDASVAVKWLVAETHSEQAARLLEGERVLVAPALLYAEAANALWALARRGDIAATDVRDAVAVLADAPINVPSSMRRLMPAAARLASDLDHPVYDCFYLALALQEQRPVVTADRRFHDTVRAHPYLADRIVHIGDVESLSG
jgi:predicted nucleic acid-binding protein